MGAIRAYSVAEIGVRVLLQISFHMLPVALVIADLFAATADGEEAVEGLHRVQGEL
jgi:hypothetical protein